MKPHSWSYPAAVEREVGQVLNLVYVDAGSHDNLLSRRRIQAVDFCPAALQILVRACIDGTASEIERLDAQNEALITELESIKRRSAEWYWARVQLAMNRMTLRIMGGRFASGYIALRQAVSVVDEAVELFPDFAPVAAMADLYATMVRMMRSHSSYAAALMPSPPKVPAQGAAWSKHETPLLAFMTKVMTDSLFTPVPPTATVFHSLLAMTLHPADGGGQTPPPPSDALFPYAAGWRQLLDGNYAAARKRFNEQLAGSVGIYRRASMLGLFYVDVIEGEKVDTVRRLAALDALPETYVYRDRIARREIATPQHPRLLQARLLFDGKNYAQAAQVLAALDTTTLDAAALHEYHYRRGRLAFVTDDVATAHFFHGRVLGSTLTQSYFKAQSAFDIAQLHRRSGKWARAEEYYKLSMQHAKKQGREDIRYNADKALREMREQMAAKK